MEMAKSCLHFLFEYGFCLNNLLYLFSIYLNFGIWQVNLKNMLPSIWE